MSILIDVRLSCGYRAAIVRLSCGYRATIARLSRDYRAAALFRELAGQGYHYPWDPKYGPVRRKPAKDVTSPILKERPQPHARAA